MILGKFFQKTSLPSPSQLYDMVVNRLILHEYQALDLLQMYQLPSLKGKNANNEEDAYRIATQMIDDHRPGKSTPYQFLDFVVKAQVHAGGRGQGYFQETGLQGGVQVATSADQVKDYAVKMLGKTLVTKQTGATGKKCNSILIMERTFLRKELYLSINLDRTQGGCVILTSEQGGVNVEDNEEKLNKAHFVPLQKELSDENVRAVVKGFNLTENFDQQLDDIIRQLYQVFFQNDCQLIQINPLGMTIDQKLLLCDQKINIDENSSFRQKQLFELEDISQQDWREIEAGRHDLNYIALQGNIGCMINGAGLAMATMDLIKMKGGMPANFLDVGGRATDEQVFAALKIMDNDPSVESILINIFAGIARCDIIVLGIIQALSVLGMKKPLVLRLKGTNMVEAQQIMEDSGFNILCTEDLNEAAEKAVKITQIMKMAREAKISINLTS